VESGDVLTNCLFWSVSLWGLFGLFPLLFRPIELGFKLTSYIGYLKLTSYLLTIPDRKIIDRQKGSAAVVGIVFCILEFLPLLNNWEFLPLLITSIVCANGLLGCWVVTLYLLLEDELMSSPGTSKNQDVTSPRMKQE
jgi:hypothetical protein